MNTLVDILAGEDWLHRAWRQVRQGAAAARWQSLSADIAAIDADPLPVLREMSRQLAKGAYVFSPKQSYAKKKSGGSRRGITVHSARDRIAQRAVLNVFYSSRPDIRRRLGAVVAAMDHPACVAGVPGRGVPYGVAQAVEAIRAGATHFVCSDVKDFFPHVPRADVVGFVRGETRDDAFADLFEAAMRTELANAEEMAPWRDLFPTGESGVPQGGLLSVLAGNLCLRGFDREMNAGDVRCVRYLDDFLILAPSPAAAEAAFARALDILAGLEMTAYAPRDGSHKGFAGPTAQGLDFLGCRIRGPQVSPSRKSKQNLIRDLRRLMVEAKGDILATAASGAERRAEHAYVQALARIDLKLRGWGDAYAFVNDRLAFAQLDERVDQLLAEFADWMRRQAGRTDDPRARRRMQGIALLSDTPRSKP